MPLLAAIDWRSLFVADTSLLEIFIRGSIVYLSLFTMLRVVLKRQSGVVGVTDLLVIVLIADAAQNAMAGEYHSITDGLVLVATIVFWSYALDWLAFYVPLVRRFIEPPPLALVKEGRMLPKNMRQELITTDDLMSQLREQGIDELSKVRSACMEPDGRISVVQYEQQHHEARDRRGI